MLYEVITVAQRHAAQDRVAGEGAQGHPRERDGPDERGRPHARELYLGLVLDRAAGRPVLMVSPDGGVEIETVAAKTPERIFKAHLHPALVV